MTDQTAAPCLLEAAAGQHVGGNAESFGERSSVSLGIARQAKA